MAVPPFGKGGIKVTVACVFPGVAVPTVGALGTMLGVAALEAVDAELLPIAFLAFTVKV